MRPWPHARTNVVPIQMWLADDEFMARRDGYIRTIGGYNYSTSGIWYGAGGCPGTKVDEYDAGKLAYPHPYQRYLQWLPGVSLLNPG